MFRHLHWVTGALLLSLAAASITMGTGANPADGVTGAPGEATCVVCHSDHPLNTIGGALSITASSADYLPGDTLALIVHLARPGQARWGFEATVVDTSGLGVGALLDTSFFTQYSTAFGKEYIKHVLAGTFAGVPDSSPGWGFRWVAPNTSVGAVTFYAAGNAANADSTGSGDFIYSSSLTITPRSTSCCVGETGDADCSGVVDVADLTALVDRLFVSFAPLCCEAEGDVDQTGQIDIGDLIFLIDHLLITSQPLPSCS